MVSLISSERTIFNAVYPITRVYGQTVDGVVESIYLEARKSSSLCGFLFSLVAWCTGFKARIQTAAESALRLYTSNLLNKEIAPPLPPKNYTDYQKRSTSESQKKPKEINKALRQCYRDIISSTALPISETALNQYKTNFIFNLYVDNSDREDNIEQHWRRYIYHDETCANAIDRLRLEQTSPITASLVREKYPQIWKMLATACDVTPQLFDEWVVSKEMASNIDEICDELLFLGLLDNLQSKWNLLDLCKQARQTFDTAIFSQLPLSQRIRDVSSKMKEMILSIQQQQRIQYLKLQIQDAEPRLEELRKKYPPPLLTPCVIQRPVAKPPTQLIHEPRPSIGRPPGSAFTPVPKTIDSPSLVDEFKRLLPIEYKSITQTTNITDAELEQAIQRAHSLALENERSSTPLKDQDYASQFKKDVQYLGAALREIYLEKSLLKMKETGSEPPPPSNPKVPPPSLSADERMKKKTKQMGDGLRRPEVQAAITTEAPVTAKGSTTPAPSSSSVIIVDVS